MTWPRLDARLLRPLAFLLLFWLLQSLYLGPAGRLPERWLVEGLTVPLAATLLNQLDAGLGVSAQGSALEATGGGLRVLRGCEGTDVMLIWVAALLVAPLSWRSRGLGLLLGLPTLFLLNQLRLIALFFIFREHRPWFEAAHDLVLPLLMVGMTGLLFAGWLRCFPGRG